MDLLPKTSLLSDWHEEEPLHEEKKWLYILALPLMWFLVLWLKFKQRLGLANDVNAFLYDGLGKSCKAIKKGAASWKALEIIYNYKNGNKPSTFIDDFWIGMRNAQAVRNRLKILKSELWKVVTEIAKSGEEIRILSLASGSAEGVLQIALKLKQLGYPFSVVLLDADESAVKFTSEKASKLGLSKNVRAEIGDVLFFSRHIGDFRPNIIEMAGLLDYLNDGIAALLLKKIEKLLSLGGYFLTCHIHHNPEMGFLKEIIDWGNDPVMLYRSPRELEKVVLSGNFSSISIETEPHGIHSVVRAQKT